MFILLRQYPEAISYQTYCMNEKLCLIKSIEKVTALARIEGRISELLLRAEKLILYEND
jgi:hypothetical protein